MQKEIKFALDVADEKPEGTIFILPVKLGECEIPDRLSKLQWVRYSETEGYDRILLALRERAIQCGLKVAPKDSVEKQTPAQVCVVSFGVGDLTYRKVGRRIYTVYIDNQPFMEVNTKEKGVSFRRPLTIGSHSIRVEYDEFLPYVSGTGRTSTGMGEYRAKGNTETQLVDFQSGIYLINLISTTPPSGFWASFWGALFKKDYVDNFRLRLDFEPFAK